MNRNYRSGLIYSSGDSKIEQLVEESSKIRKTSNGRPRGSKTENYEKTVLEKENLGGTQLRPREELILAKNWALQSKVKGQTEDGIWHSRGTLCVDKYGMIRSMHSIRRKWPSLEFDCQLCNAFYKYINAENRTGNAQTSGLEKPSFAIYQGSHHRQKEMNPGI